MQLRPYQKSATVELIKRLRKFGVAYLSGEVRTGKTAIALTVAAAYGNILFVTKKKAIQSIKSDADALGISKKLFITNYESLHKIALHSCKVVVLDEAHCLGQFPKPGTRATLLKEIINKLPVILLSGTPSPESYSQLFHQFWVTNKGPWAHYQKFYKWAKDYVNIGKKYVGFGRQINDYSQARPEVMEEFKPYAVAITQADAGFDGTVVEHVHRVEMPANIQLMLSLLKRNKLLNCAGLELTADTGAKMMSMTHQLSSGTVIDDSGHAHILSKFKLDFIKRRFRGIKIAIFYVYVKEGEMLRAYFNNCTDDPQYFNSHDKAVFICQVAAGREGINLSSADAIIFMNISYSAVSYWQARARSQSQKGGDKEVHWIFSDNGPSKTIEQKIYEVVQFKKNFTLKHFHTNRASLTKKK